MPDLHYEDPANYSEAEAEAALVRNDAQELQTVVIGIALYHSNLVFAERFCLKLSAHQDEGVRGNAVLGFGHLARRFGRLQNADHVKEIIVSALNDSSPYVRGHADSAQDDVQQFLRG